MLTGRFFANRTSVSVLAFTALATLFAFPAFSQISLGSAQNFAVLGSARVTNTGASQINGSVGVSPGTETPGFGSAVITNGTIQAGPASTATQAQADLTIAYNAAAAATCTRNLTGLDLGSVGPLTPGVYCFDSSAQLTGTLVLDLQGDPNALFIFKTASDTLTTASNSRVMVINPATTCPPNIFFQVGSSATLGTGTQFVGNILAQASITLTTGATLNGRALARTGAVTLDTNVVGCAPILACPVITVNPPPPLPAGTVGTPYPTTMFSATPAGTYTFTRSSGTLPPGLALSSAGALTGTPTTAGTFNFTVTARDAAGCFGTRDYSILINPGVACPPGAITVNPATLPDGTLGNVYSAMVSATPAGAYMFSSTGTLPPGLTLNTNTGAITGTPTTPGTFNFTIRATNAAGCFGERPFTIVVCPLITVNPVTLPDGTVGSSYSATVTVTPAGTYTLSVTGTLPPGLTFNTTTGAITGTPTTSGMFMYTIRATDGAGCFGVRSFTTNITAVVPGVPALDFLGFAILSVLLVLAGLFVMNRLSL